jgi:hypothetical protein
MMKLINNIKRNKLSYILLILGIAFWITHLLCYWYNNAQYENIGITTQYIGMLIFLAYLLVSLGSLVEGIGKWNIMKWKALIPFCLSIFILFGIRFLSGQFDYWYFKHNLQYYNQIVEQIQSGKIDISSHKLIPTPKGFPAHYIDKYELDGNKFMVGFVIIPQRYSFGYLYISEGKVDEKRFSIKVGRELKPHWYTYSD